MFAEWACGPSCRPFIGPEPSCWSKAVAAPSVPSALIGSTLTLPLDLAAPLTGTGMPSMHLARAVVMDQQQRLKVAVYLAVGIVTAMTDMFNVPSDLDHKFLIRNNLPGAGGASGSAMIGPSGKIVGFEPALAPEPAHPSQATEVGSLIVAVLP